MAAEEDRSSDFYAVMGLKKECTPAELRNAYKKLAMKWHPDRCRASANQKYVEEAKKKFQDIQQAYTVLSDANKRFLYDVGVYNNDDDDDENGMGDFLNEMAAMMNQTKSNENTNESYEDLQQLFQEIFQSETADYTVCSSSPSNTPQTQDSCSEASSKRKSSEMSSRMLGSEIEGEERKGRREGGIRREGRKQKISSGHDVTCRGISCCKM